MYSPYGWHRTTFSTAVPPLSASTSLSNGVPNYPMLRCPLFPPPCAPHSCPSVSLLPAFPVCTAYCQRQAGQEIDVVCVFLSNALILYSKTIATIRPRIIAYTTKSFYNNWLELNLVVLQVYLYYIGTVSRITHNDGIIRQSLTSLSES